MAFQSSLASVLGFGVVGERYNETPTRAKPYILNSADASYNVFGRAFTLDSEGKAKAGGTGAFIGLMVDPKEHLNAGTSAGGTLAANLTLANGDVASILSMGEVIIAVAAAASVGDRVYYDTTTGVLGTTEDTAAFTASQSTTVLTVSAITAGTLGIGSIVNTGSTIVTIVSLGTGTGGTGTYNVSQSQTVGSGAMTAPSVAPSGKKFVPSCLITQYNATGAGLAVAKITA